MVRRGGFEPPRLAPQASETCVSASSTISAAIRAEFRYFVSRDVDKPNSRDQFHHLCIRSQYT